MFDQNFNIHLVDVNNVKNNSILVGIPFPTSSLALCASHMPQIPFPFPTTQARLIHVMEVQHQTHVYNYASCSQVRYIPRYVILAS